MATPAAAQPAVTAQHGGLVEHAAISGDFAYVAQGSSVVTLRLGDSSTSLDVASVSEPLGGWVWAVAVHRNRLYASWGDLFSSTALSIFSLDDPGRPSFLGHLEASGIFPFSPNGLTVMGDVLYLLSYSDLVPIDLADPDRPVVGVPVDAPWTARVTPYDENHLIAWGPTIFPFHPGALVFDVSAPLAPVKIAEIFAGFHHDLDIGDGFIVSSGQGFRVFDLSDPADPIWASSRNGFEGDAGELVGRHYLVADGDRIRTWDLNDLANPVEVASRSAPVVDSSWAFHDGDRALFFSDLGRAVEFDVFDPSDPTLASSLDLPVGPFPVALAQVGSDFYVADAYRGLRLLDAKLRTLADLGADWHSVNDVSVEGTRALFADFSFGVRYVNVSTPTSPVLLGEIPLDETLSVEIDGDRGWVTAGTSDGQLVTLDLSTPTSPQIVHSTALGGRSELLRVGDRLYVADQVSGGGLRIFDVSGAVPVQLSRFVDCQPQDVDVFGSIAALPCAGDEMQLVDVSDPAAPTLLGTYEPDGTLTFPQSARFGEDGQLVYLGMYNALDVVDVSDPTRPVQRLRLDVGGFVDTLETDSEGRVWALGGPSGLARIDQESGVVLTPQSLDKPSALRRRVD